MKIVINPSYGYFDISESVYFELIKRNAKCILPFKHTLTEFLNLIGEENEINFTNKLTLWKDDFYKHPLYETNIIRNNYVYEMTEYVSDWRYDSTLISIIEEAKFLSNNENGYLKVVEIPDDIKFYIDVSDSGFESVHENHRVWS